MHTNPDRWLFRNCSRERSLWILRYREQVHILICVYLSVSSHEPCALLGALMSGNWLLSEASTKTTRFNSEVCTPHVLNWIIRVQTAAVTDYWHMQERSCSVAGRQLPGDCQKDAQIFMHTMHCKIYSTIFKLQDCFHGLYRFLAWCLQDMAITNNYFFLSSNEFVSYYNYYAYQ